MRVLCVNLHNVNGLRRKCCHNVPSKRFPKRSKLSYISTRLLTRYKRFLNEYKMYLTNCVSRMFLTSTYAYDLKYKRNQYKHRLKFQ